LGGLRCWYQDGITKFLKRENNSSPDQRFVGRWQLLKDEGAMEIGEGVMMTFTADGKLVKDEVFIRRGRQFDS
jgi:hypothetical protein